MSEPTIVITTYHGSVLVCHTHRVGLARRLESGIPNVVITEPPTHE